MDTTDVTIIGVLLGALLALTEAIKFLIGRRNGGDQRETIEQIKRWRHEQELRQVKLDAQLDRIEKTTEATGEAHRDVAALIKSQDRLTERVNELIGRTRSA
jgi:Xaa-Pro aminopeptidase